MIVQKNKGCDHITCYCSYQFCYLCNQPYSHNHKCNRPQGQHCLQTMFLELDRDDSLYNKCLHCGNILNFMTPNSEYTKCSQYTIIILFTLLIYPIMASLLCLATIGFGLFWLFIFLTAASIYVVFYPLMQIFQLKSQLSQCLIAKGIPKVIVRVLTLLLYPVHIILMIIDEIRKFTTSDFQLVPITHFVPFFLALPCLMMMNTKEE